MRERELRASGRAKDGSAGQVLGSLLSILVTLGLVFAVPVALVVFVGWPLPGEVPTWEALSEGLEQQGITVEVLINALAVVVWFAWLPLTWAIAVETLAAARGRAARRVRAWPGAQYLARKLVASATLLLSSFGAVRTAGAAPLDPLMVAGAEAPTDPAAPEDPYTFDSGDVIDLGSLGSDADYDGNAGGDQGSGGKSAPPSHRGSGTGEAALAGSGGAAGSRAGREPAMVPSGWDTGGRSERPGRAVSAPAATFGRGADEPRATARTEAQAPEVVHEVEQGDSFWGLADEYLGSGLRWREIRDYNIGRAVAVGQVLAAGEDHLQGGWRILIPVDDTGGLTTEAPQPLPTDASPAGAVGATDEEVTSGGATDEEVTAATADARPTEVTVQSGDHLWGLAERQLTESWGRPVTAEEVAPYWQQLVAENLDRLGSSDPDLIYPGERFTAPPTPLPPDAEVSAPPAGDQAERPDSAPSEDDETTEDGGEPRSSDAPAPGEAQDVPADEPSDESSEAPGEAPGDAGGGGDAEAAPPATVAPDNQLADDDLAEVEESLADAVDDDEAEEEDESSGIPLAVPLGASAALAGLLLVALGRRRFSRRRQLRPGQVVEPREPEDAELERELALGSRDVLATVDAASRGYGAVLAGNPELPPVTGLVVSPARDVVVHLAEPAVPEIPFERGPASTQWDLYLDELDLDPEFGPGPEPSASVLDTPAVIGRTDEGDWVLIDLESVGALEIEGDEEVASDLVRSIVAELSMAPQAERMVDITVVGVAGLAPDVLEQGVVSFDRLDEDLVRRVERVAAETDSVQPHRGAAARAQGMPRDGLFVMVVALGGAATPDPVLLERLAAASTPGGRGIAVVAVGALGPGATRVLVDESGDAHIPHMGITVDAVQLAAESLQRVERLLADEPEVFPPSEPESVPEAWPEWPDEWSSELSREAPGGWMGAWLPANGASSEQLVADDDLARADDEEVPVADGGMPEPQAEVPVADDEVSQPETEVPGADVDALAAAADALAADATPAEEDATSDDVAGAEVTTSAAAAADTGTDTGSDTAAADTVGPDATDAEPDAAAETVGSADTETDGAAETVGSADAEAVEADAPARAQPPPTTAFVDASGVDTVEADDLDDRAPNEVYRPVQAEGLADPDSIPPLAPVPPLPDVELPPVETPEAPPGPEPLDLREEPRWPDPRTFAAPGGPPDVPGAASGDPEVADQWVPTYTPPPWELCVRIFSDHIVETADGERVSFRYGENPDVPNKNTHRGPELISYLALCGRAATAEEVQDHLWWDRPIALSTVNKLIYGTRKVLGGAELLSHAQEDPLGRYRLAPTITTDAQLLAHGLEHAHMVAHHSPEAAIDVLRPHLAGLESVAFRNGHLGQGLMEWGAAYRVIDAVELPVIEAALLFSRLSCERGRAGYFDALWGVDQGLRACPYNEALVRVAMEIEALLGNTDAVNHRYLSLATKLARDELEPEPETSDLRVRLGGTSRLRSAG